MNFSYEEVSARLRYDPMTGHFIWIGCPKNLIEGTRLYNSWKSRCLGKRAGHVYKKKSDKTSYRSLSFEGCQLKEHRLAFLLQTGKWPDNLIDHINGDGTDNRWVNLRHVDNFESAKNMPRKVTNKSGVTGVTQIRKTGRWKACITHKRVHYSLGNYLDWFEAVCARKSAEIRFGFHENHGR